MPFSDIFVTLQWWGYIFVIGLIFFPLTSRIFANFFDRGYLFAKVVGVISLSYLVFVLGTIHLFPFTRLTIVGSLLFLAIAITTILWRFRQKLAIPLSSSTLIIFEEVLFLVSLLFWSFIRAHQPDIFGLEKYMDFGFVNSILRSTYFPPRDMWYTPYPINYYYFGHLTTAVLTKLSDIPSDISFNLMIATLFAFCFGLSFSLAGNLWQFFLSQRKFFKHPLRSFIPIGLLGGFLVTLGGNLHTVYTLFKPYNTDNPVPFWQLPFSPSTFPNAYWYPNATRFIYHTIHEFPSYSFVVSDLHGHVLDIPFVLTTLAVLLVITFWPTQKERKASLWTFIQNNGIWFFYGFLVSIMYMTNAWDSMIYTLAAIPIIIYKNFEQTGNLVKAIFSFSTLQKLIIIFGCYVVFSLPFSLFFDPGKLVGGIGMVCPPQFLITIGHIGPFVFEPNHCMRSPLWQLLILYGFFLFWLISFVIILFKERNKLTKTDVFAITLSGIALFLIVIPEFFYLRDIYTTYFRANTMFKLVYQAFIIFSLANAYMMARFLTFFSFHQTPFWKRLLVLPYGMLGFLLFILVSIYPYFGIYSYYGNLTTYRGLPGTTYLAKDSLSDAAGIMWLNKHVTGQPVILEAQGDSYTEYARVSSNTGLPTVLGWPVHEWLWRGTYDIIPPRSTDIQTMYETANVATFKALARKYHVSYVFVGSLEWEKYPTLNTVKFGKIGKVVFHQGVTTIYQLPASL